MPPKRLPSEEPSYSIEGYDSVVSELIDLVESARRVSARSVHAVMTATYWGIGRRIVDFEQRGKKRAEYGEAVLRRLAVDLTLRFGRGFGAVNLAQMRRFFLTWPKSKIFQTVSEKSPTPQTLGVRFPLSWSHYVRLMTVSSEEARNFYETEALRSGWSVRQLDRQISSQFYERISTVPE